ncbi:MAG: hypothetical protein NC311_11500 [Muribaculaceae bacterium]|nr:hypothetical protein [Muribaculaceae bacterium]
MTTKEDFIKRYNAVKENVINAMDMALERAIGNSALDFDAMQDNYADIYPFLGAVLQREVRHMLEGSSYESVKRAQKRQASKYRKDYRIWMDYAGDYRNNGE